MKAGKAQGFTLVELMTIVLVAAIVVSIGIPAYAEFNATHRMAGAINDISLALHASRTEAVKRRANVTLCPSTSWNTSSPVCDTAGRFADGWIAFVDCTVAPPPVGTCGAPNMTVDVFDTVLDTHGPIADDIAKHSATNPGTPAYVSFSASGFPRTITAADQAPKTDFQFCDERGNHDVGSGIAAGRWLHISSTGRPQVYRKLIDIQGTENPLKGC